MVHVRGTADEKRRSLQMINGFTKKARNDGLTGREYNHDNRIFIENEIFSGFFLSTNIFFL